MTSKAINIVFAKAVIPPNLIFVEIEDDDGASIRIGEWSERANGDHVLRIVTKEIQDLNKAAGIGPLDGGDK